MAIAGVTRDPLSSQVHDHWPGGRAHRHGARVGLLTTAMLGLSFLCIQINEYIHLGFAPSDNAQSTIFYGLTGLHGAHVFVGLTLLTFATVRAFRGHFTAKEHRGVEVPGIYWHFATSCGSRDSTLYAVSARAAKVPAGVIGASRAGARVGP